MFDIKKYHGDEKFLKILDKNAISIDIYTLKAAILGVQASGGGFFNENACKRFF